MKYFNCVAVAVLFFAAPSPKALAVFPFVISTDGSSVISNGSWSGDGTVQPNVASGATYPPLDEDLLINDFTSGTLSLDDINVDNDSGARVAADLTAMYTVSFTGGTGDLYVVNSASFDGGTDKHNSLGLRDLAGVTQIDITFTYDQYIAGRNSGGTNLDNRPMLSALGLVDTGTGLSLGDFNVNMNYSNVYSTDVNTNPFVAGIPGAADPLQSGAWTSGGAGATAFAAANGFAGTVALGDSDTDFLLVRGYDYDGAGGYNDAVDSELVYALSQTWTITLDSGTFASDTHFTFSLDGQQFSNLNAVPEPGGVVLIGTAFAAVLLLRRRRPARHSFPE